MMIRQQLRTLRWSAWLAWQVESNWAHPWLFVLYVLAKPLAASMLLVCMYWAAQAATGNRVPTGFLPFLYVGSACYMLVGGVTFGMSQAVITDREQYGMLKFIRLSPVWMQTYLVGRGLSRALQAIVGVVLALVVGLLILPDLRTALDPARVTWLWLGLYFVGGLTMLLSLGLMLAGTVLNLPRHGMFLSEGVAGLLYLFSGVVFPIDILPGPMQWVSRCLPTTYWLEGMRLSLLGHNHVSTALRDWTAPQLVGALALSTTVLGLVAWIVFRWCERRAWTLGRFDEVGGY